jgi:hypothetical protein
MNACMLGPLVIIELIDGRLGSGSGPAHAAVLAQISAMPGADGAKRSAWPKAGLTRR